MKQRKPSLRDLVKYSLIKRTLRSSMGCTKLKASEEEQQGVKQKVENVTIMKVIYVILGKLGDFLM